MTEKRIQELAKRITDLAMVEIESRDRSVNERIRLALVHLDEDDPVKASVARAREILLGVIAGESEEISALSTIDPEAIKRECEKLRVALSGAILFIRHSVNSEDALPKGIERWEALRDSAPAAILGTEPAQDDGPLSAFKIYRNGNVFMAVSGPVHEGSAIGHGSTPMAALANLIKPAQDDPGMRLQSTQCRKCLSYDGCTRPELSMAMHHCDEFVAAQGESEKSKDERLALKQQLGAGCHDECGELPADDGYIPTEHRRVRCNHRTSEFDEQYIDINATNHDSGETCPVCGKGDALMDLERKPKEGTR